jgi:translation elongation factor EF-1alpha
MADQETGKITHYFGKISVAVIKLTGTLKVGDSIKVKTHAGEFTQKVDSMQVDKKSLASAVAGNEVGLKVAQPVKEGDIVYKVS